MPSKPRSSAAKPGSKPGSKPVAKSKAGSKPAPKAKIDVPVQRRARPPVVTKAPPTPARGWGDAQDDHDQAPPPAAPVAARSLTHEADGQPMTPAQRAAAVLGAGNPVIELPDDDLDLPDVRRPEHARPQARPQPRRPEAPEVRVRLQRVLAEAGVAARRRCEELILAGRVSVNGQVVRGLPAFVDPSRDRIVADGRELPRMRVGAQTGGSGADPDGPSALRKVYIVVNKPERVLTATADDAGRATVLDLVKYHEPVRLFPVGRLEYHARGLVLLTNDGALANALTHPRYGSQRVYEARVKGLMPPDYLADLERGLNAKVQRLANQERRRAGTLRLELAGVKRVDQGVKKKGRRDSAPTIDRGAQPLDKTVLRIILQGPLGAPLDELMAEAGVRVSQLIQVGLGPLRLLDLRVGEWRPLSGGEVRSLRRVLESAQRER